MAKRFYKYFPWLFIAGDLMTITASVLISKIFWPLFFDETGPIWPFFVGYITVWLLVILRRKDYKLGRTSGFEHTLEKLFGSFIWFLFYIALLWIIFQNYQFSRTFLFFSAVFFLVFLSIYRVGVHFSIKQYRIRGRNFRNAVIIGMEENSRKLAGLLLSRKDYGINFLGYFDDLGDGTPIKGNIDSFFKLAGEMALDLVYINENLDKKSIREVINYAEENYIKIKIIPSNNLPFEKNLSFSRYGDFFVINVNEIPLDRYYNRLLKRGFDLVFSAFVIVFILSWMVPLVGILIKMESKGPVFFIQKRNGENNRVFRCIKFRSMTPNDYADTQQAQRNDPRITGIGSFLRTYSLDEMPQFWNVLRGEMSIVGPRPHSVPMNELFKDQIEKYNSRHKIKPGITGLAQVKGFRGEIERPFQIRSRVRLDYFYIKNWSIWMDLNIIFKTIHELAFNKENAY